MNGEDPRGSATMADRDELARLMMALSNARAAEMKRTPGTRAPTAKEYAAFILASPWFARVRVEEREACAKVAENPGFIQARDTEWDDGVNYTKRLIATAIRERNQ